MAIPWRTDPLPHTLCQIGPRRMKTKERLVIGGTNCADRAPEPTTYSLYKSRVAHRRRGRRCGILRPPTRPPAPRAPVQILDPETFVTSYMEWASISRESFGWAKCRLPVEALGKACNGS